MKKVYNVKIYLQTLSPIVAPSHTKSMKRIIIEKRKLREKYGDIAEHLDYLFSFALNNKGEIKPIIKGKTLKGAVNYWLGLSERDYVVENVFLDENDITIEVESLTQKNGKKTLCVYEFLIPSTILEVNLYTIDKAIVEILKDSVGKVLYIGKWRRKGFGKCKIVEIEVLEKSLKLPPK